MKLARLKQPGFTGWVTLFVVIGLSLFAARRLHEAGVIPSISQELVFTVLGICAGFVVELLTDDEAGERG